MAVRIGDTLKQINNADFPIVEAMDVAFESGDTLQELYDSGALSGGGGASYITLSQEEYDVLSDEEKVNGSEYRTYDTGHIYKLGIEYGKDSVQISDNETVEDKTWSSKKTSDEIAKVESKVDGLLDNSSTSTTSTWSSSKIAQQDGIKNVFYASPSSYPSIFWTLSDATTGVFWFKHTLSDSAGVKSVEGYADLTHNVARLISGSGSGINVSIGTDTTSGKKGVKFAVPWGYSSTASCKITEVRPVTAIPTQIVTR